MERPRGRKELDFLRENRDSSVAEAASRSRAGLGQVYGAACCLAIRHACFTRQPCMHLGHTQASYKKAAPFKMKSISLGQSGTYLIAKSISAVQLRHVVLQLFLLSDRPNICCDESSSHQRAPCIHLALKSFMLDQPPALS